MRHVTDFLTGLLALVVVVLLVLFFAGVGQAHEAETGWTYPGACCNKRDCRHMEPSEVHVTQRGYFLPGIGEGGSLVTFAQANSSPDGQYHVCVRNYSHMGGPEVRELSKVFRSYKDKMNRSPVCFWAPEGSS